MAVRPSRQPAPKKVDRKPERKKRRHPAKGRPEKGKPDVKVQDTTKTREPAMVTGASTTAPADAGTDPAADQADQEMQAFFGSGVGPALHYDASTGSGDQTVTEGSAG